MINPDEYLAMLSKVQPLTSSEVIPLTECLNRILAEDVIADMDQPPFNKSAMDGYACKRDDLPGPFTLVGEIAAGRYEEETLQSGRCFRIFTGAPVPAGADCVIMQEDVVVDPSGTIHLARNDTKNNICYQGEDVPEGEIVLKKGTLIKPHHIAVMASFGKTKVEVVENPVIKIICSGSELVEPSDYPLKAQIRNSNAYQLLGQIQECGFKAVYSGICPDSKDELMNSINKELDKCDLLIVTGGASVGDYDLLPDVLLSMGAKIHFSGLNIQPGKPVLWASLGSVNILGLSGNPVSSYIQFLLVAKPMLYRLCNSLVPYPVTKIPLSSSLKRRKGNRKLFHPIMLLPDGYAKPLRFNGSAHISSLVNADGFAVVEPDTAEVQENELVNVILF